MSAEILARALVAAAALAVFVGLRRITRLLAGGRPRRGGRIGPAPGDGGSGK